MGLVAYMVSYQFSIHALLLQEPSFQGNRNVSSSKSFIFPLSLVLSGSIWPSSDSFQFSRSVVSNSSRPHESQHARPPCTSPTPRVYANSMSIESVMPSNHLILCRPLLLLPTIPPSIRVFSNESTLRRDVAKVLEF